MVPSTDTTAHSGERSTTTFLVRSPENSRCIVASLTEYELVEFEYLDCSHTRRVAGYPVLTDMDHVYISPFRKDPTVPEPSGYEESKLGVPLDDITTIRISHDHRKV